MNFLHEHQADPVTQYLRLAGLVFVHVWDDKIALGTRSETRHEERMLMPCASRCVTLCRGLNREAEGAMKRAQDVIRA